MQLRFSHGLLCIVVLVPPPHPACVALFQEYNINGWWVGELNGTVGIVPKDFVHPAYIL